MKRKLLSLILVVAMLASVAVFTPAASAAESKATLAFSDAVGVAGDEVTIDLTITTETLQGVQFMMEYDSSRLEFAGFEDGIAWTTACGTTYPADLTNNKDLKVYTTDGPYLIPSCALGSAKNFSAGVVMATFTFTIKGDAPIGDAYVKFVPLADGALQPNKLSTGSTDILMDEMTLVDGAVTVLPEGYSTESVLPPVYTFTQADIDKEILEYELVDEDEDEVFDYAIISGYEKDTYEGILVLPSVINDTVVEGTEEDYPVVGIGVKAFNNDTTAVGFVIPESVTRIAAGAFFKCTATDFYVMNAECEIGKGAMGATGSCSNKGSWTNGPDFLLNDNGMPATIHGVAGSTAEAYATAGLASDPDTHFGWVAGLDLPTESTLTVNGETYYFTTGATVAAPGMAIVDGKTVIAWTDGTNTYAAGADITITEDVVLEPVTITAPTTTVGADIKLAAAEADLAMRFTATLSKADYATLAELGDVTLGMLITPAKRVAQAGSFTKEALDALEVTHKYVDIAINGYYKETTDDYILAGSLKGFSATTLAKNPDFAAVVYATVETADGATFTVYGDFNFGANQNVKTVATDALAADLTNTQKGWLNTLIGKFGA